jgi:hypothetical protein
LPLKEVKVPEVAGILVPYPESQVTVWLRTTASPAEGIVPLGHGASGVVDDQLPSPVVVIVAPNANGATEKTSRMDITSALASFMSLAPYCNVNTLKEGLTYIVLALSTTPKSCIAFPVPEGVVT